MKTILGLINFNRLYLYLVGAGVLLASIGIAIARIRASGARSERLNQMQARLRRKQLDAEISADLGALSAAVRRRQLRERWGRH